MKYLAVLLIMFISLPVPVFSAGPAMNMEDARALLETSDLSRGNVSGIEWDIDIKSHSESGVRENALTVTVRGTDCLAVYQAPARVRGQKLLMKDRNMWFTKPGLSKPIPISPRQKLLGGASSGDIASTNYAGDYTIEAFQPERLDTEPCLRYDLKANHKNVTYDTIRYWVSIERKTGMKAEFFTLSGKMFKTAFFEYGHTLMIDGEPRPFVSKMTIVNALVETEKTVMAYKNIRIKEISPSIFNLNFLAK